jgi:hypothetical protein
VGSQLRELTSTCLLGRKLFEGALRLLTAEEYRDVVDKELASLANAAEEVTTERI